MSHPVSPIVYLVNSAAVTVVENDVLRDLKCELNRDAPDEERLKLLQQAHAKASGLSAILLKLAGGRTHV